MCVDATITSRASGTNQVTCTTHGGRQAAIGLLLFQGRNVPLRLLHVHGMVRCVEDLSYAFLVKAPVATDVLATDRTSVQDLRLQQSVEVFDACNVQLAPLLIPAVLPSAYIQQVFPM